MGGVYLGQIGCGLFFIISGCGLAYNNTFPEITKEKIAAFYKKRVKALYPMYWIAFIVATILSSKSLPDAPLSHLLFSFAGLDGYSTALGLPYGSFYKVGEWFLGCIFLMYLVYPVYSFFFLSFPLLTMLSTAVVYSIFITRISYIWFFLELPYFLIGMIFVRYFNTAKDIWLWLITLLLWLYRLLCSESMHHITYEFIFNWTLFLALVFIVEVLIPKQKYSCGLIKTIGKFTYPVFLVHHAIISKICSKIDLAFITYDKIIVTYIVYITLSCIAAFILQKVHDYIIDTYNKKREEFSL